MPPGVTKPRLLRGTIVLLGAVGFSATPTELVETGPVVCLSRLLLDAECWGCGMTRALSSLAHGELGRAVEFNRGVIVVAPLLLVVALQWIRGRPEPAAAQGGTDTAP